MAYALGPLIQILEQDYHHLIVHNEHQIESLLQKACILRGILEESSQVCCRAIQNLDNQIRDVAHKAEDILESHITDYVSVNNACQLDMTCIMNELDSITKEMSKTLEGFKRQTDHPVSNLSCVLSLSPEPDTTSHDIVKGFDEVMGEMLDHLKGRQPNLEIIPVVGMGGIGKTTLVRKLFKDPSIDSHFDIRAWVTVSQEFNAPVALLALLRGLVKITDQMCTENEERLGEYVHKTLIGRRYLIVVDDIWDTKAWDKMKRFFPENNNRSRIILTTREQSIAKYAKISINPYQLPLINADASWDLLQSKVFGHDGCPPMLMETGRNIARNCGGLPLAILVMAGLLSMSERTLQCWQLAEKNVSSVVTRPDLLCFKILSMSYNNLPYYLKPCFLYVGAFPEDYEIQSSKIVKLWIAEGFIKPVAGTNLEDTAEAYLNALIGANLLLVCRKESDNKVKTFKIHDLLREFCQKKAINEKFLLFKFFDDHNIEEDEEIIRRVSAHPLSQRQDSMNLMSVTRSFLCIGRASLHLAPVFLRLRLLRVLDVFQLEFHKFPEEILQLVNLKYLAISCRSDLSSSISRLRNLQTLIIRRLPSFRAFTLPSELWEMSQLKHIKSKGTCIWYYPKNGKNVVHNKLQTLYNVHVFEAINKFFEKIPSLTKLGIFCDAVLHTDIDLACLSKLEILKCSSYPSMEMRNFLSRLKFPDSLKKLTLNLCKIPCGFMTTVGSLPNLEQLKLHRNDFLVIEREPTDSEPEPIEPTWEPTEGGFPKLRFLLMDDLNLVHWKADSTHFPNLEHLVIRDCCSMEEISNEIGDIETLELIEVDDSSPSVLASAMEIQKQQEKFGNDLQVIVHNTY